MNTNPKSQFKKKMSLSKKHQKSVKLLDDIGEVEEFYSSELDSEDRENTPFFEDQEVESTTMKII